MFLLSKKNAKFEMGLKVTSKQVLVSLYIQSRMIAPPGWAPLQSKQSVLSLIVLSDWSSLN